MTPQTERCPAGPLGRSVQHRGTRKNPSALALRVLCVSVVNHQPQGVLRGRHPRGSVRVSENDASSSAVKGASEGKHGSEIVKVVPFPCSLSTVIVPSCSDTIFRQMARPRPVPPVRVEK